MNIHELKVSVSLNLGGALGRSLALPASCVTPGGWLNLSQPLFLVTSWRVRVAHEGDTDPAAELLVLAGLARDVPIVAKALEGTMVGPLSRAAHGQVHHRNSRHFRGNYQRVSLNNQFPSAPATVLTGKGRKGGLVVCWAGDEAPLQSSPSVDAFKFH